MTRSEVSAHIKQAAEAKQAEVYYAHRDVLLAHDAEQRAVIAEHQKRIDELIERRNNLHREVVEWRGIEFENVCTECSGSGYKVYGNTSTYHHGLGWGLCGQAFTTSVCNKCWGSGDRSKPWTSWLKIEHQAQEITRLREALAELYALVKGECPSLLNEDSGGDAQLDMEIEQALAEKDEKIERLKQEAQIHAQEARTANHTIAEIYQVVCGATGEPGNWHGAEPVRQALAEKDREIAHLKEKVAHYDRWLSVGVYFTVEEYQERVYKPHQQLMAQAVRFAESVADYDPYHGGKRKKDAKAFLKEHQS